MRAFKAERVLEVWAGKKGQPLTHIKAFPICAASGQPGPKRARGDSQVPEGLYEISLFNPLSNFHLSLKVSYPNAADRILGTEPDLGGDIFIHGSCASVGCLAIEDGPIEELYVMAQDTVRKPIAIHIFPTRVGGEVAEHAALWHQLEEAQKLFDRTHRPPNALVDKKTGAYLFPMALPKMRQ